MKRKLPMLAAAVAALLTFGGVSQADRAVRYEGDYAVREYRDHDRMDERPLASRVVSWPVRATRTVVRTPVIIGETLAGDRELVRDDGRVLVRSDESRRDRVYLRDRSDLDDDMRITARRTGRSIERGMERTGRFIDRTGRTIVRAPEAIAERITDDDDVDMFEPDGRTLAGRTNEDELFDDDDDDNGFLWGLFDGR